MTSRPAPSAEGRTHALGLLLALATAACGGSNVPRTATHEDFRTIQRAEASLQRQHGESTDPRLPCTRRCAAPASARAAAATICAIAEETFDPDATRRCERGRRIATAAARQVMTSCPCPADP